MNKRKVLLPLDGSVFSQQVLPHIPQWFSPHEVEVILFRVMEEPSAGTGAYADILNDDAAYGISAGRLGQQEIELAKHPIYTTQIEASIRANAKADLTNDKATLEDDGFAVSAEIVFGNPAKQIIDFVARNDIDIIAMTTHGRTGLRRLLMGSVAEKVLRHITIPVLLVHSLEQKGLAVDL